MISGEFLIIDGITYKISVDSDITRTFDVLDKYAKRVESGTLKRKIIGVYKNYVMNFGKQTYENFNEYEKLVDKLTEATEFHTVQIGNFSFTAYISTVSDTLYRYKNGKEYYTGLKASFTAKDPWRTP